MAYKMKHRTSPVMKKGPCWKGYEMVGMKKKGGRKVPNCVPKNKQSCHLKDREDVSLR